MTNEGERDKDGEAAAYGSLPPRDSGSRVVLKDYLEIIRLNGALSLSLRVCDIFRILLDDEDWRGIFGWRVAQRDVVFLKPPPFDARYLPPGWDLAVHANVSEEDILRIGMWIDSTYHVACAHENVHCAILLLALQNPVLPPRS